MLYVMKNKWVLFAGIAFLLYGQGRMVQAQEQEEQTQVVLEELVVTARRREESLQEVPIAISALSQGDLESLQIENFGDVGGTIPNLNVQTQFGSGSAPSFSLRGQTSGLLSFQVDSRIGLYIDGVYLGRAAAAAFDLANTCQLEVLRGPQGTLFGRNSTGGAIDFKSCAPADEFSGNVEVTTGDYSLLRYKGAIETGVRNGWSARLSFVHSENDGYVDNSSAGITRNFSAPYGRVTAADSLGEQDSDAIGLAVQYSNDENLMIDYRYDSTDKENSQLGSQLLGFTDTGVDAFVPSAFSAGTGGNVVVGTERRDSLPLDFTGTGTLDVEGHALTLEYNINESLTLKNILSYRDFEENTGGNDIDGNTLDATGIGVPGLPFAWISSHNVRDQDQTSNELQLLGTTDKLDWLLGGFYFKEKGDQIAAVYIGGLFPPLPEIQVGNISAFVPSDFFAGEISRVENKSSAAYGHINYRPNDKWVYSVGLRHTNDDREESVVARGAELADQGFNADFSYTDWDAAATYFFNEDISMYAKASTAHLSGGILGGIPFNEEEIESVELGLKSELFDRRLRLNAVIFSSDISDLQTSTFSALSGITLLNAGESEQNGLEVEIKAILSENWSLDAALGLLDDKRKIDLRSLSPESNAYLGIEYTNSIKIGQLSVRIDAAWVDDTFGLECPAGSSSSLTGCTNLENAALALDKAVIQKSNTQLSGRITLSEVSLGESISGKISLWGRNLLDTDEIEFVSDLSNGTVVGNFQIPRTVGIDLGVNF